jgi:sirohydrochlorin cobaltochelatase
MKSAVIVVSFGTSHRDARNNSLEQIYQEIRAVAQPGDFLAEAYTSSMIIRKLAKENIKIYTVDEAVKMAAESGARRLYVVSTHMIPGIEYRKLTELLEPYKTEFAEIRVTTPVLDTEVSCRRLVPVLKDMYQIREDYEYILMGHGTEDMANIRYAQMNQAFREAGMVNVRIASVEAKPDLEDAMAELSARGSVKKVILHPFMVVAGEHAKNDMAGEEDSYASKLREAGYPVEDYIKGLGEYPEFRKIYRDKFECIQ